FRPRRRARRRAGVRARSCARACGRLEAATRRRRIEGVRARPVRPSRLELDVVEEVGALLFGRSAVDVEAELLVTLVSHLQRRSRLDCYDALRADVDALVRIAEEHRQPARDDDEDLLLHLGGVSPAPRSGGITPDAAA